MFADFFGCDSERPKTPPIPFEKIPFSRDADFVNRESLLAQLHEKVGVPGARVALVGLGGVG